MYSSVNTINWKLGNTDTIFSLGTGHCELLSPARKLQSSWKSIWLQKQKRENQKVYEFDDADWLGFAAVVKE